MSKTKQPTLTDIADRIHDHLQRFERDPKINVSMSFNEETKRMEPKANGHTPYYHSSARRAGRYVKIVYIAYQGGTSLTREDAVKYLKWLDAGNVGKHHLVLRQGWQHKARAKAVLARSKSRVEEAIEAIDRGEEVDEQQVEALVESHQKMRERRQSEAKSGIDDGRPYRSGRAAGRRQMFALVMGELQTWVDQHGEQLKPPAGYADSFGDGMRKAKDDIRAIMRILERDQENNRT